MNMEEEAQDTPSPDLAARSDQEDDARREARLETRVAQAEAQIRALQDRMMEINAAQGSAKQRALWARVFLLAALLGAFFIMRSMQGGG